MIGRPLTGFSWYDMRWHQQDVCGDHDWLPNTNEHSLNSYLFVLLQDNVIMSLLSSEGAALRLLRFSFDVAALLYGMLWTFVLAARDHSSHWSDGEVQRFVRQFNLVSLSSRIHDSLLDSEHRLRSCLCELVCWSFTTPAFWRVSTTLFSLCLNFYWSGESKFLVIYRFHWLTPRRKTLCL